MFHRLTVPMYYGGLIAGRDYLNTPSLSGGSGVPSSMDGQKSGGPNDGTYLVAFGEDATSTYVNRGFQALGENTDELDDYMRRDLAITARTADVVAGGPVSSITIAGSVFVGAFGVANNQAQRDALFSVLDANDNEIIVTAGTKVQVTLVHDGSSNNVVGVTAGGFRTTTTALSLNVPIPTGVTYRVYYGERSNLASLPIDAFTTIKIRGAQEVSAEVERVLRDLHSTGILTDWNATWLATITSLACTGLDGRYRLTAYDPGPLPMDVAGAGGTITRDGPAVKISCPGYDLSTQGLAGTSTYPDPLMACLRIARAYGSTSSWYSTTVGGNVGLLQESPFHSVADANERTLNHTTGPLLLEVSPRDVLASTLGGAPVLTRINTGVLAFINPAAGADATSRRTLLVGTGDFLSSGGQTALRSTDYIELTEFYTGAVIGTYRVDTPLSTTTLTLKTLVEGLPVIAPAGVAVAVNARWIQPTISIGGRSREGSGDDQTAPHFFVAPPSPLVSTWDANAATIQAVFLSALVDRSLPATNQVLYSAMCWGGFDTTGEWAVKGTLFGDGGIVTEGGRQVFTLVNQTTYNQGINDTGGTLQWDPFLSGSREIYTSIPPAGPCPITVALSAASGYVETPGDVLTANVYIADGTVGPMTITWPSNFVFSGSDGVIPSSNLTGSTMIVSYVFRRALHQASWFAVRTDY